MPIAICSHKNVFEEIKYVLMLGSLEEVFHLKMFGKNFSHKKVWKECYKNIYTSILQFSNTAVPKLCAARLCQGRRESMRKLLYLLLFSQ